MRLKVRELGGARLELAVSLSSAIMKDVKTEIYKRQDIHPECQLLLRGETVLDDWEPVGEGCDLQLIVTTRAQLEALESESWEERWCALAVLKRLPVERLSDNVVAAVRPLADDENSRVRQRAGEILARVATKRRPEDIALVIRSQEHYLADVDRMKRCYALSALADLGAEGGEVVISVVLPLAADCNAHVREAAMQALAKVASRGHAAAVAAAAASLADEVWYVRRAAVHTLARLAPGRGDRLMVALLRRCLGDPATRRAAARALAGVAAEGDAETIVALREALESQDDCGKPAQDEIRGALRKLGGAR